MIPYLSKTEIKCGTLVGEDSVEDQVTFQGILSCGRENSVPHKWLYNNGHFQMPLTMPRISCSHIFEMAHTTVLGTYLWIVCHPAYILHELELTAIIYWDLDPTPRQATSKEQSKKTIWTDLIDLYFVFYDHLTLTSATWRRDRSSRSDMTL